MKLQSPKPARPDYGIDGPFYLYGLIVATLVLGAAAVLAVVRDSSLVFPLGGLAVVTAVPAGLGAHYMRTGKQAHRDRLLDQVVWRGNEQVLDVGTGGGLMMIGAAKRTPEGQVFGVDVWRHMDLSGNGRARVLANAAIEGVTERIEVRDEDARSLSFASATFDVVLSMLCLHNIDAGRELALAEIARVLKPGGTVVISDLAATTEYVQHFKRLGFSVVHGPHVLGTFPFQRMVVAQKPLTMETSEPRAGVDG